MLGWASAAGAQNRYKKLCDPKQPKHCAQAVLQGERVPFDGQLYSKELAVVQSERANTCDTRLEVELSRATGQFRAEINYQDKLQRVEKELAAEKLRLWEIRYQEALAAAERRWYEHPVIWIGLGIVGTVAAVWGGVAVIEASNQR